MNWIKKYSILAPNNYLAPLIMSEVNNMEISDLLSNLENSRRLAFENFSAKAGIINVKYYKTRNKIVRNSVIIGFVFAFLAVYFALLPYPKLEVGFIIVLLSVFVGKISERIFIKRRLKSCVPKIEELNTIVNLTNDEFERTSIVPLKYWDEAILIKMIGYIQDRRADSLKDCINLYEFENSQRKYMDKLDQISYQQREILNKRNRSNYNPIFINNYY